MTALITKIRNACQSPKYGAITLLATVVSGIVSLFTPIQYIFRMASVIVILTCLAFVAYFRYFTPQIQMTCLQDSQFSDIKNLHHRQYPVYNGYAEIEVYAEIPAWMTEFEIELNPDGPFNLSEWTPEYMSRSENTLICKSDIDDCKFKLQVIGEADELGDTTYNLYFKNGKSKRIIHSIKLVTEQEIPQLDKDELTEEEAEEWGLSVSEI